MQLCIVWQFCRRESYDAVEGIKASSASAISIREPPQFTGLFPGATLGFC
jgi:hypothetical protein